MLTSPTNSGHMNNSNPGVLSFKDHGLLLCEIHVLWGMAQKVLPRAIMSDFVEEVHDLEDIRKGVHAQIKVVERIRWYDFSTFSIVIPYYDGRAQTD